MKRLFIIIILLLILSIVFLVMSGNGISYQDTEGITEISPYSSGTSQLTRLYFIYKDQLISENRTIKIEKLETELAAVKELKNGSKIESYKAPINDDVDILSVNTQDRICYVNLSKSFLDVPKTRLYLNVMSIVNTLTELDSVDSVQVLIDGKRMDNIEQAILSRPLARNTTIVQSKELTHKDIVKKFLEYVSLGKYHLAYDMIDDNSKGHVNFDDFRETMLLIRNDIKGYTQRYMFAKREKGEYIIQVTYVLREYANSEDIVLNSESPLEIPFSWPVIQEKGVWKIKFYRNQEDAN